MNETPSGLDTSRRVRINGTQVKTSDELLDHSRIIWLTPAMDGLFNGSASERRRFFDRMVLAINPAHGRQVADFEKAMRNRNRLLAEDNNNGSRTNGAWLDAIETQMAELGIAIAAARMELISLLGELIISQSDSASPFPDAVLSIEGSLENVQGDLPASDLEREYANRLHGARFSDRIARRTLEGSHRSDLKVLHRAKSMPAEQCSTGEQKALLVGIILAHAQLTTRINGFAPILLLDEITAHLDGERRAALFDRIDGLGSQAFMTGTDRGFFDTLGKRGNFFKVHDGKIMPQETG